MKIGIVCPYDMIKGGGVQEIVKAQANGLRKRGHKVIIITPRPPRYTDEPEEGMVFVGRSNDVRLPTRTTIQVSVNGVAAAEKLLEEEQFDILHFHEPWVPSLGFYLLPKSTAVNVATFHGKLPEGATVKALSDMFRPFARSFIKDIDVFVAASYPGSEYVSTLTDHPVTVIPVDIDMSKFKARAKFDDDQPNKTILYVGRLEGRKGVRYLIEAFALLQERRPDVRLELIGNGPQRSRLETLVDDLGARNVSFLGYRDNDEKIKKFGTVDLFCAPSIYGEGFGMVLLEAMATGVPMVAGDNPGYSSVLTGLGAMSLVNPRDTTDFARRLELMLYQKELRAMWRKWAQDEVEQYSTEHMIDKYERLYKNALKQKA
jgi:phosphatidyl-myo-inositol alpha-mannosyltransferase